MDIRTYQLLASKTDRNPGRDDTSRMVPLAGLASETGELLGEYKKYLRDGAPHRLFTQRVEEEIGDLLWYVANVASKFDIDLETAATRNLEKCANRWGSLPDRAFFDEPFPSGEQFPRQFSVDFSTSRRDDGSEIVKVTYEGAQFGSKLGDNSHIKDGYGYHDVLHLAFAGVLSWSPLVRKMLHLKRKSAPAYDMNEDGGRAIAIEEGLSAVIFAYARDYDFLEGKSSLSSELLRTIRNMVRNLEVCVCTAGEWERAIIQGFDVWRQIRSSGKGTVSVDLLSRSISLR